MVIGKIKPQATIVAQFAAGVEIDAIQHEGKMYLPVVGMGEFAASDNDDDAPAKPATKPAAKSEETKEEKAPATKYTEDDLMDMESKELVKILKKEYNIDPDDYEGKNTNKKLRLLILDAQKGGAKKDADEEDSKKKGDDDENNGDGVSAEDVSPILDDFDSGKKNRKKTLAALMALNEDADEDAVGAALDEFDEDDDADIDETAEKIAAILNGEEPEEKKSKKGVKKEKKEKLVEPEDLKVGDRVSVWWDDDNQEWYDGEVKSIKKGKVLIAYDDDTEETIDPEVHTKIKLLD
jgi:hypothetical protein